MVQIAFCQHFHHIIHAILNTCAADDSTQNHCQETFFSALFAFPPMTFNPNSPSPLANNGVVLSHLSLARVEDSLLSVERARHRRLPPTVKKISPWVTYVDLLLFNLRVVAFCATMRPAVPKRIWSRAMHIGNPTPWRLCQGLLRTTESHLNLLCCL